MDYDPTTDEGTQILVNAFMKMGGLPRSAVDPTQRPLDMSKIPRPGDYQLDLDPTATESSAQLSKVRDTTVRYQEDQSLVFASLPEDVLRRILEFLLKAEEVEKTWLSSAQKVNFYRTTIYDFHTAILRTCSALNVIGKDVFHSNNFILVTSKNSGLHDLMNENRVHCWSKNIELFKDHRLQTTINASLVTTSIFYNVVKVRTSFIICAASLLDFVVSLRTHEALWTAGWQVSFQLKSGDPDKPLSNKTQKALLKPFMSLRGRQQSCTISKPVDPRLEKSLVHSMTPRIFWHRAYLRECYNVIMYEKAAADRAMDTGDLQVAARLYDNAADIANNLRKNNMGGIGLIQEDDPLFWSNYHDLLLTLRFGVVNCYLLHAHDEVRATGKLDYFRLVLKYPLDLDKDFNASFLGVDGLIGMHYGHLVANVALGQHKNVPPLANRLQKFPALEKKYTSGLNLARIWARNQNGGPSKYPKKEVNAMIAIISRKAIKHKHHPGIGKCKSIDVERYALKALGYDGDLLESELVQDDNRIMGPTDFEVADAMVRWKKKDMARQKSKGQTPVVWIKPETEAELKRYKGA